jgi:hypothetical protein
LLHDNASSHKVSIVREYLNQERLSSFLTLLGRQISHFCDFFLFSRLKNTLLEENMKREKMSVRLFSNVWTEYLEKITYLKIWLKD